jgi:hypothetical protein
MAKRQAETRRIIHGYHIEYNVYQEHDGESRYEGVMTHKKCK